MISRRLLMVMMVALASFAARGEEPAPDTQNDPAIQAFTALCDSVRQDAGAVSEQDMLKLLAEGQRLGMPFDASLAVSQYLGVKLNPSPKIVRAAVDNALLTGDLQTAMVRCKNYLGVAPSSVEASEVAAILYATLIDILDAEDEAYRLMTEYGPKYRQTIAARRFDAWYVAQALKKQDLALVARRLGYIFSDNMPLDQERYYFWETLDWVIAEMSRPVTSRFAAADDCLTLSRLIRGDKFRQTKAAFYAANLAFKAGAEDRDEDALDKAFAPVIQAARAYLAVRPNAQTLQDILQLFADGDPNRGWRQNQVALKQTFFMEAFSLISDADRETIMAWNYSGYIASPEQWVELGTKHRDLFLRSAETRRLPVMRDSQDRALFVRQASYLQGTPTRDAAMINALAASQDFNGCIDHLMQKEAWHLDDYRVARSVFGDIWNRYSEFAKAADKEIPQDYYDQAWVRFGVKHVATSAIALDLETARDFITYGWRICASVPARLKSMETMLALLDWVPYSASDRQNVFGTAQSEFANWRKGQENESERWQRERQQRQRDLSLAEENQAKAKAETAAAPADDASRLQQLRDNEASRAKEVEDQKTRVAEAESELKTIQENLVMAQSIDAAFSRSLTMSPDLNKAPNPVSRHLAEAVLAEAKGDAAAFVQAARALYPLINVPSASQVPMAQYMLRYLIGGRTGDKIDTIDFQCEVLADQLSRWDVKRDNPEIKELLDRVMASRQGWGWGRIPKDKQDHARKINAVLENAVATRLGQGNWKTLFDWMVGTRSGQGWVEKGWNEALFDRIIQEKRMPAVTLMAYVRPTGQFDALAEKYPVATYFDDTFVAEVTASRFLDNNYWNNGGQDKEKKIANLAARMMLAYGPLPYGYGDETGVVYDRATFSQWQERAMQADEALKSAMISGLESRYGKDRFDDLAMGKTTLRTIPSGASAEDRQPFFAKLAMVLGNLKATPVRDGIPHLWNGLQNIGTADNLSEAELAVLLAVFDPTIAPPLWPMHNGYHNAVEWVQGKLVSLGREHELFGFIPTFLRVARDSNDANVRGRLVQFVGQLENDSRYQLAAAYSRCSLDYFHKSLGHWERQLTTVRAKSMAKIGSDEIMADASDPRSLVFVAQANFFRGNVFQAWEETQRQRGTVLSMLNDLDVGFIVWFINMNNQNGDFGTAETAARALITMIDADASRYSAEMQSRVVFSYADIAFYRMEYPRARALYGRLAATKEFQDTKAFIDAKFRMAEIDRLTGQYGEATKQIEEMLRNPNRYVQMEGFYHLALVKYDMRDMQEAQAFLDRVFALNQSHALARILEGRLNLRIKDYEKASEIRHVGVSVDRDVIVPGKDLRISLIDENLSVVGKSSAIELRVWTDSGDEELIMLLPFADSKTHFEGRLATGLGAVQKGDSMLQLLGDDKVYYDFSDEFRKTHKVTESVVHALSVASDAALYASSGVIPLDTEIEQFRLEQIVRARLAQATPEMAVALSTRRNFNQVKPGNSINVRVIDHDRNVSSAKDHVVVRVTTTSGDTLRALPLLETETHSGVFEAVIPTDSAPATAYATDSLEGRVPNFTISSGQYPAWVALPDGIKPKTFSVDLNDFAVLGKMKMEAGVAGRRLKDFLLQISTNGKDFDTVGSWPETFTAWSGAPMAVVMKSTVFDPNRSETANVALMRTQLENSSWAIKRTVDLPNMAASLDGSVLGVARDLGLGSGDRYIARISAAFYLPRREEVRFKLQMTNAAIPFVLTVNGQVTSDAFSGILSRGVHRIDVYFSATAATAGGFALLRDAADQIDLQPCPASMFDPVATPEIRQAVYKAPAGIVASADQSVFDITFGAQTEARVLRLLINDYETDAPAIEKIHLQAPDGTVLLPTLADLMALRENDRLEIVPGDTISISYEATKYVDPSSRRQNVNLSATYANGSVSAVAQRESIGHNGELNIYRVPLRRFAPGDAVTVMINDPDLDVSGKLDVAEFTARTMTGNPITLKALETDIHSGIFIGRFFPVEGPPARASELQVDKDDEIVIAYLDNENTDPGIPWQRDTMIEQAWYQDPELRIYNVISRQVPPEALPEGQETNVVYELVASRPETSAQETPAQAMLGSSVLVELVWPTIAFAADSTASLFVQTAADRQAYGDSFIAPFDPNVPNTKSLTNRVGGGLSLQLPFGYDRGRVVGDRFAGDALEDGRFNFTISTTMSTESQRGAGNAVRITPDDMVHVGFKYDDEQGNPQWLTREVSFFNAEAFFDVMDRRYEAPVHGRYIGEAVYFRVVDMHKDVSGERDSVTITLETDSGLAADVELVETMEHSGMFKGHVQFVYATTNTTVEPGQMPVRYGDIVTATYKPGLDRAIRREVVEIFKGSDGDVIPFSKQFNDPEMAFRTRLSMAEAYFELAKRHRRNKQMDLAESNIAEGKRLMEEALADFPATELRVQADYLLANLVLELAEETEEPNERNGLFRNAVVQFGNVIALYGDTPYAPRAQFKKALALEKMGDIDAASEEYVRLAYRWPDNELVAETIARLGKYFFDRGRTMMEEMEIEEDPIQQGVLKLKAAAEFVTAAEVFASLEDKFPSHTLAHRSTALAAQSYMRAGEYRKAITTFEKLIDNPNVERNVQAESMYWCGECYFRLADPFRPLDEDGNPAVGFNGKPVYQTRGPGIEACYRTFKNLTWKYPESVWARYARGRLSDPLVDFFGDAALR